MHVQILFTTSEIGGAERSLTRMAHAATGGTTRYRLATLGGEGAWSRWARQIGLIPHCFGEPASVARITPRALIRAIADIWRHRPDIIYVIGIRASLYLRLLRPVLPRRTRIVVGIRFAITRERPEFRLMRLSDGHLGWLVSGWVANSEAGAKAIVDLVGCDPARVAVVHNGIASGMAASTGHDPDVVLTIANLIGYKGHIPYLEAVCEVVAARPRTQFWFVGRDDLHGAVQKEVSRRGLENNVRFLGFREDAAALLNQAALFVLPSLYEGLPTSILEAMAAGKPSIAFALGGIPELIEEGVTGRLVAPGDYRDLARRILEYLETPRLAAAHGAAARDAIRRKFSFESMVALHDAVWARTAHGQALAVPGDEARRIGRSGSDAPQMGKN